MKFGFLAIFFFFLVALLLAIILFIFSYGLVFKTYDYEKLTAYECGFDPFGDARVKFDVRFYLVSILFIIFDLEITFLFPWSVVLETIGLFGFFSMIFFLIILTVGFVYEWFSGALDW